jgi:uncharacterized protein YehS (DUF1456 family)
MDQKQKWSNDVVLKMLFIFFSFKPVTISAVMEGGTLQQ